MRDVESYAGPIQVGDKTYQFSIVHDITRRKQAEDELRREHNFVSAVLDVVGALVVVLDRITNGHGKEGDLEKLEELAYQIKDNSLCGLGQTAPNPVLTTIKYFRDEYEAHISHKKCPAKVCRPLLTYKVDEEKCTG
ncbi:MAG: hypothetical protein HGB05_09750, partial [Chloroflexi bacterium]|nr:hypothetical protein [Chloroflexota bacterium]